VDCHLVILVKLVKKVILEVPNAPVVTLVKRVRVTVVNVNNVRQVNHVHPMIQTQFRAHRATLAIIKQIRAKHLVCHAFLALMRMIPVQPHAKIALEDNIKMRLAMKHVWIAKWVNT
jgi:hypothetical protein